MKIDSCWLPMRDVPASFSKPSDIANWELAQEKIDCALVVQAQMGDAFSVAVQQGRPCIYGGETGVLYGAYRVLAWKRAGLALPTGAQKPAFPLRMIDQWDNMDGTVERGYAGKSLLFGNNGFQYQQERIRAYARLLASVGVNVLCINNVNVIPPAQALLEERFLPEVGMLADIFKPFGIRLMLSVDFAIAVAAAGNSGSAGCSRTGVVGGARRFSVSACAESVRVFSKGGFRGKAWAADLRSEPRGGRQPSCSRVKPFWRHAGMEVLCVPMRTGLARYPYGSSDGGLCKLCGAGWMF